MAETITKKDLLKSLAFETALTEGAEYKKSIITTYKKQNKDNYQRFQEKKKRTEADNEVLKKFKSDVSTLYRQTTDFLIPEKLEDGKKSKVEKIVEKIMPVISMLRYIDENILDKELAKHGLQITAAKLEDICPGLATDDKKKVIKDIFNEAKNIKMKVAADNEQISDMIFNSKVPIDL
jgi:acetolactate synthase small subunit